MDKRRRRLLIGFTAVCLLVGVGYVIAAALKPNEVSTDARPKAAADAAALSGANLMVRAVDRSDPRLNGRLFVDEDGKPTKIPGEELACERVYYAAGHGICMAVAPSGVEYEAIVFDSKMKPLHHIVLTGLPSRARVSADGRYGAMTVFVSGDSYLGNGGFSTRTTILDMHSGEQIAQLEQFDVTKEGEPFEAVDFNFWGVTFAKDPNTFYATLRSGGHYYLVEGNLKQRTMKVLRDGVECPSLSPDGTQIAFKSRIGSENRWRIEVLDLDTLAAHRVAEHRSIDDQVEWLNDDTLVYSNGLDVFTVPADGSGEPKLLLRDATSPVALRGKSD